MNMSTGFRLVPLAAFLGKPVPRGMRGVPQSTEFFCSEAPPATAASPAPAPARRPVVGNVSSLPAGIRTVAAPATTTRVVTRHRPGKKKKKKKKKPHV